MAIKGIRSVVNETFIKRFAAVAAGDSSSNLAKAIRGGASTVSISEGLRLGARTFATAVQNLNSTIGVINISRDTLEKLGKITDKLISLTSRATERSASNSARQNLNAQFNELANEFQAIVDDAEIGEREFLSKEDLGEIFTLVGLDPDESSRMAALFDQFIITEKDDLLASETVKGTRPVPIPSGAFTNSNMSRDTVELEKIFDGTRSIATRPSAYRMLTDLNALREQIDDNVATLDKATKLIEENINLVRAAGFAFLNLSEQINDSEEASMVAREVRDRIRKEAGAALSQIEHLEPIAIAALAASVDNE